MRIKGHGIDPRSGVDVDPSVSISWTFFGWLFYWQPIRVCSLALTTDVSRQNRPRYEQNSSPTGDNKKTVTNKNLLKINQIELGIEIKIR
jgi:hypothetical protein